MSFPTYKQLQNTLTFIPLTRHPSPDQDHAGTVLSETEGDYGLNCPDYILVDEDDIFGILIPLGDGARFEELVKLYEEDVQEWLEDQKEE